MRSIYGAPGEELVWRQPHALQREYELRAGDEVLASLRWQRGWGSIALADTADGRWTFKRQGFWRPRVTSRLEGAAADVATFEASWTGGGTLAWAAGESVRWEAGNFWHSQWAWLDRAEAPLVTFTSRQGILDPQARVEITANAATAPELALLVTLGWYLLVLHTQDVAVSTASTTAVVASS